MGVSGINTHTLTVMTVRHTHTRRNLRLRLKTNPTEVRVCLTVLEFF